MRSIGIGARLGLGFGLIIVLMLAMSGIGGRAMFETKADNATILKRQVVSALALHLEGLVRADISETQALAGTADPKLQTDFHQNLESSDQQVQKLVSRIEGDLHHPKAKALFEEAMETRAAYDRGRAQAFADEKSGNLERSRAFFQTEMPKLTARYIQQVQDLAKFQEEYVASTIKSSDYGDTVGMVTLGVATLLALLFSPWFAWRVAISITHPLLATIKLARSVAARNLSQDIQIRGKDEITQLETALHEMVVGLHRAVSQVREGADSIDSAAAEISAGNTDLASRTEQQSASLTQTAASMEEITAAVRQTTENAEQADRLAKAAVEAAGGGGEIVERLVATMADVNAQSQKVAEIIGVIDSIAFQTNILALNAAVEAARAGEQGRGFAVVASEVRALAQRSATSAREIKSLVEATVEAISRGHQEAEQAGAGMQRIVANVQRVTDIVGEISSASREQTTGIEQVNIAVTQMDDVTRQNASLVEESSASAAGLEGQADSLARLVATFDLGTQREFALLEDPHSVPLELEVHPDGGRHVLETENVTRRLPRALVRAA